MHALFYGPTGAGKSTLLRQGVDQIYEQGLLHVIDLDLKADRATTLAYPQVLDFEHLEFSPIAIPPGADRTAFLQNTLHVLLEILWGAELQRSAFAPTLETLWQRTSTPSLADWQEELRKQKSEPSRAAANRLDALRIAHPKLFHSTVNLWLLLHECSLYLSVRGPLTPATRLIFWWIVYERWRHLTAIGNRAPHTLILLDEGDVTLRRVQTPTGTPTLAVHALLRMREAGITFWVGTPTWDLDPSALANFGAQLILRPNGRELLDLQRHLQLNAAQLRFLATMPQGTMIGKFSNAPHTFIATFEKDERSKTPDPKIVEDARQRTIAAAAQYATVAPAVPLNTAAAREEDESNGQPTPSQTAAPSSSPPSRVAPVVEKAKSRGNKIALSRHATALMHDLAKHPFTLTTPSFRRCNLRLSEGERAKTTTMNLGFLESHRVRTGAGRGKTGSALRLTPAGWQWLGRTPAKGTRGGDSVQHAFLIHELARRIPRSTIETLSVDLVIPYNTKEHANLLAGLQALSARTIALNNGDVIAFEVECSMPERTAPRNITRDAGFALTVIAILGKHKLTSTFGSHVVIVDVLRLLDALRTTEEA